MLETIKNNFPNIHIKAFTAVEIDYFAVSGLPLAETLQLKNAGLDSMPEEARDFNARVRSRICPEKISGKNGWM
jgi:aminodeoxyfutalosine synthase